MRNILPKELKIKFIESISVQNNLIYDIGNPFQIKLNDKKYFVFLKNLSPAYFKKSPDVTRVQLPYSNHFGKIFKGSIPLLILGYDVDNDSFVCWNPKKIKERLNARNNVSLYSRLSLQSKFKKDELKLGYLSTGEMLVLFKRNNLDLFFNRLPIIFNTPSSPPLIKTSTNPTLKKTIVNLNKLEEITDKELLKTINPLLKKNRVLEVVEICSKHYGKKYSEMTFKDWFTIVNLQYKKIIS